MLSKSLVPGTSSFPSSFWIAESSASIAAASDAEMDLRESFFVDVALEDVGAGLALAIGDAVARTVADATVPLADTLRGEAANCADRLQPASASATSTVAAASATRCAWLVAIGSPSRALQRLHLGAQADNGVLEV